MSLECTTIDFWLENAFDKEEFILAVVNQFGVYPKELEPDPDKPGHYHFELAILDGRVNEFLERFRSFARAHGTVLKETVAEPSDTRFTTDHACGKGSRGRNCPCWDCVKNRCVACIEAAIY